MTPRDSAIEVMLAAVHENNEYGQWASQLWGGWGDDDDLRKLFDNLLSTLLAAIQEDGNPLILLGPEQVGWSWPKDGPQQELVSVDEEDDGMERQWRPVFRASGEDLK